MVLLPELQGNHMHRKQKGLCLMQHILHANLYLVHTRVKTLL